MRGGLRILMNIIFRVFIFLVVVTLSQGALQPGLSLSSESCDRVKDIPVATADDIDDRLVRNLNQIAPAGWHLEKPVKLFNYENLWEQINGQAASRLSWVFF